MIQPYPWQAFRTKTFSKIRFVLKFLQFQAYNNFMVYITFDETDLTPFKWLGSFSVMYRICSIVNQPEKHRKIHFIVSSIHSYSIECFDVNLQIDIADKENIAFSGFQTSQRLFWKRLSETNLGPSKSIPDWIQGALLKGTVQLVMVKELIESRDNSDAAIFVSDL